MPFRSDVWLDIISISSLTTWRFVLTSNYIPDCTFRRVVTCHFVLISFYTGFHSDNALTFLHIMTYHDILFIFISDFANSDDILHITVADSMPFGTFCLLIVCHFAYSGGWLYVVLPILVADCISFYRFWWLILSHFAHYGDWLYVILHILVIDCMSFCT